MIKVKNRPSNLYNLVRTNQISGQLSPLRHPRCPTPACANTTNSSPRQYRQPEIFIARTMSILEIGAEKGYFSGTH